MDDSRVATAPMPPMPHLVRSFAVAFLAAAAHSAAVAQPPAPCASTGHRQFDFWLGTWDVTTADGKPAGRNRITSVHNGCALLEQWEGRGGFTGTSLNAFDATAQRWHQTWVDASGGLLRLDGTFEDGRMRLEGDTADAERAGARVRQRIEWTPQGDGRVRQHWQASKDGGRTWSTVFDGWYRKLP